MMSVPNNTVRTREFTFAFEPKTNPKTGSEEQVMDKIPEQHKIDYIKYLEGVKAISDNAKKEDSKIGKVPAALQHKIDYINALDITAHQKAVRTSTEIIDYWAAFYGMKQSPKRIINEDVTLANKGKVMGGGGGGFTISNIDAEALKVGFASIKNIPALCKPIGPADEKIKEHIITWQYLAVLLLAAISGNLLGFAIFTILERTL
jgi:hypothetical protein